MEENMNKKILSITILFLFFCFLLSACSIQISIGTVIVEKDDILYITGYNGVYSLHNNKLEKIEDFYSKSPVIYNEWLYFVSYDLNDANIQYPSVENISSSKILRFNLNNGLTETIYKSEFIDNMSIIGQKIIFSNTKGEGNEQAELFYMNLDGTEIKLISDHCIDFVVDDQDIYVYEINNNQPGLFKLSSDGSTRRLLYDNSFISSFFPYGDLLYIATYDAFDREKSNRIYAINLDSLESYAINDLLVHRLVGIRDNWIYYDTYPEDSVVNSARLNLLTGEQEILVKEVLGSIDVSDQYLLYQKDSGYTVSALNLLDNSVVTIP
jgi:hypothetical protein